MALPNYIVDKYQGERIKLPREKHRHLCCPLRRRPHQSQGINLPVFIERRIEREMQYEEYYKEARNRYPPEAGRASGCEAPPSLSSAVSVYPP